MDPSLPYSFLESPCHSFFRLRTNTEIPLNKFLKKNPWQLYKSILGRSESLFGLTNTAPSSSGKIEAAFRVILLRGPRLLFGCCYYEPLMFNALDRTTAIKLTQGS